LRLDGARITTAEPITGRVRFKLLEPRAPGLSLQILASISLKPDMIACPLVEARFKTEGVAPVEVGRLYEIPFRIDADPALVALWPPRDAPIALFAPGRYEIDATITGPYAPHSGEWGFGPFTSERVTIEIADKGATPITRDEAIAAIGKASGRVRDAIVEFA